MRGKPVVAALTFYLCSVARLGRRPRAPAAADDVNDREATPTAVTSLSPSARRKESASADTAKTGLLRSLLPTASAAVAGGGGGAEQAVTWYGSRDVEVGRPTNVRYVSLRRVAQQSSSIESEAGGAVTPTGAVSKRPAPKRFGFVGWTRPASASAVLSPGESLRHQSSGDSSAAGASLSFGENEANRLAVNGRCARLQYTCIEI